MSPVSAVPTDEIYERYLRKAIGEINDLERELETLADELHVPVKGSGHPLADVFLLKWKPQPSEIQEGVAYFGRAGQAVLKSLQRLAVDPLAVYGTNCFKFGTEEADLARTWLERELHIVQPKLVVCMGAEVVRHVNAIEFPLSSPIDPLLEGSVQRFTPTIGCLVTPDIDGSLDEAEAKTRFWQAFKALGTWWSELPPY